MVQLHVLALLLNNVQIICKKINMYGFIRVLYVNVENGMFPEKNPLFETSL